MGSKRAATRLEVGLRRPGQGAGAVLQVVRGVSSPRERPLSRFVRDVIADPTLLTPRFQPILSLESGRIVGFEALARVHPDLDRAPISLFREARAGNVGAQIEALAIQRALDVATAASLPPDVFLSVNVSPLVLGHPALWEALKARDMRQLVIELTEDDAVDDYGSLRRAMRRYVGRGARFAIDDTGAGFASMRHLTELWPAFFKLDAMLTHRLGGDERRQALVRALAMLARDVGATLVVEGVERPIDLAHLARTGLPLLVQGYAIARPGPPWPTTSRSAERAIRGANGSA
jgi:EAL domain-containing protein (putative c-di-GMP-specific phosphodiesterase class I)